MNHIVEIIKAVAWPVTVLILFLIFFSKFRSAFDYFLRNIRTLNFPGGSVETQDASKGSDGSPKEDKEAANVVSILQGAFFRIMKRSGFITGRLWSIYKAPIRNI